MSRPNREQPELRQNLRRVENEYVRPLKNFVKESYAESPVATTAVLLFALSSVGPLVAALAAAIFTVWASVTAGLLGIVGIFLTLAVVLSTTLISSLVLAVAVMAFIQRRNPTGGETTNTTVPETEAAPAADRDRPSASFPRLLSRLSTRIRARRAGRPRRFRVGRTLFWILLASTIFAGDGISRLRLPAGIRYGFMYRKLFGSSLFGPRGQRGHPIQRLLSLPFFLIRHSIFAVPIFLLRVVFFGPFPYIFLAALIFSPRLRRRVFHGTSRLWRAAYARFRDSELQEAFRNFPWNEAAMMGLEFGEVVVRRGIAALTALLQALEQAAEERAQQQVPRETEQPSRAGEPSTPPTDDQSTSSKEETASVESYEIVGEPVPMPTADSEPWASTSTLRSRVTSSVEEED
ncbi:hypothetical protein HMN09_01288300 [Mycena chlorophos]|uniref:Transmembrane protein n=1 Tax=Mycena chlorophos TaxID=658473 RepID=A0A8H6S0Y5_MYCCL|nr:hypothetical protein HMN09_01288300 [Mycena chlorophos]